MTDANYSSVSLLLHGAGGHGSTKIIDDGYVGAQVIPSDVTISTAFSPFAGGSSIYLNGSTGFLTIPFDPQKAGFLAFPGDFTVEFQIRVSAVVEGVVYGGHSGSYVGITAGGAVTAVNGSGTITSSAGAVVAGAFVNIAITRLAGVVKILKAVGGVWAEIASGANSGEYGYGGGPSYPNFIGKFSSGSAPTLAMHLSEFRVTKGVGRYTPGGAAPTGPLEPHSASSIAKTARHWRLNVAETKNFDGVTVTSPAVATLQLVDFLTASNLAVTGAGRAWAGDVAGSDFGPEKAFDGNNSTSWYASGTGPHTLRWDFGAGNAKKIAGLVRINSSTYPASVTAGSLEYSDDLTTWVTLASFSGWSPAAGNSSSWVYAEANAALIGPAAALSASGGGSAAVLVPTPTLAAYGGATAMISPSAPTLSVFGGASAAPSAPSPTLFATAHDSTGERAANLTAPKPALSAFGGASTSLTAPSPSLTITATVVNFGSAELRAPSPTLSAAGTVSGTSYADLTFGNNLGSYDLIGYSGAVCSVTLTGSPTIRATGTTGATGRATLTAPLFELTATGTAQNYGSAALLAPVARLGATARAWVVAPGATLTAIGTAVVVATYEAYAVNLNHTPRRGVEPVDEVSRYTNFPFTHVVRYQNSYFGANSTGLYLLEGTTDAGAAISYAVKTATSDLSSPNQKTVASAYLGGRLGPSAAVTLYAGEGAGVPYTYTTPRGALAQNHRQVFGKGIKQHRFYALGLSGSDAMELDSVELDVKQMNRRI